MTRTQEFEGERPRLLTLAGRILGDHAEAEDVVQQAWLRLHGTDTDIESLPAWLTTVTTRLCLDRLKSRTPVPHSEIEPTETSPDVADEVVLADTVGVALQAVIDRLSPGERVAFVLHDSFGFDFATIAAILGTTPVAARKLASRARGKARGLRDGRGATSSASEVGVRGLRDGRGATSSASEVGSAQVVDAFMAAARGGDFASLLALLAPDARVDADAAAVTAGTPERIEGREEIAAFFDGSAHAALAVLVDDRPGAGWFHRGEARVLFDFAIEDGLVRGITFRADPEVLAHVTRREDTRR